MAARKKRKCTKKRRIHGVVRCVKYTKTRRSTKARKRSKSRRAACCARCA